MSKLFLSYGREDVRLAKMLESALITRRLSVWRDEQSIEPGQRWALEIEAGLRGSRGVIVLLTSASARSQWLTYEYALAIGARLPVVAVRVRGAKVPSPIQQFQVIDYSTASSVAREIDEGILLQSRRAGKVRASAPQLLARFQEDNGRLIRASGGKVPAFWMELWLENTPKQTRSVAFEIADVGFRDGKWVARRGRSVRQFLTDDMSSYGDVEISARGRGKGVGEWFITSRLYEALTHYYGSVVSTAEVRRALKQIRDN
jgi:hypothetical protein